MPVYTYQCEECGVRFDARQKFSDEPITVCPECHGATHRVITPVGVVFKGSGFYVTDSRSKGSTLTASTRKDKESDSTGASSSKADAKSTSTPAASPPPKKN